MEQGKRAEDELLKELERFLSSIAAKLEKEHDPTKRFLRLVAALNTWFESRGLGRLIVTGGFAVELYTGTVYRTLDVDLIVEGGAAVRLLQAVLERLGERIGRGYLLRWAPLALKSIDIVSTVYSKPARPVKLCIEPEGCVYLEPPEELIVTYLAAWKYWGSTVDRDKALWLYAAWVERLDKEYLKRRAREEGVEDFLQEIERLVEDALRRGLEH
jgi:hypothetical protein